MAALSLWLGGCGKIKSAVQSLLHTNRTAKSHPAPPARPSRPGAPSGKLAIILDDVGGDAGAVNGIFALHYPLTLSVLPNHAQSTEIAKEAHRRGYQVMLHLPMESLAHETAEAQELRPGMSPSEISGTLDEMLRTVPYAAGVNNHQGSRATADAQLMSELMPLLRTHRLFFIDSRTIAATVAYDAAQSAGVRCASRNVPFLDDVQEVGAVRRQLELAVKDAREKGQAIAIGHPHPATLRALAEFLPEAESQGIRLVHASDLVH
ncbi:MAG TPA: divergent polysaccharide deacetylase family protein [Verrucomicrobiae bacterium]|nr:divergent polysaccharide deacetylase family protein [Verrucomicrobiae bacterium]